MNLVGRDLLTFESQLVLNPTQQAAFNGTGWAEDSKQLLGQLGYWLANELSAHSQRDRQSLILSKFTTGDREILLQTAWIPFPTAPVRRGKQWISRLPDWLVRVDQLQVGDVVLDRGVDFAISGNDLITSDNVGSTGVIGWNVVAQTFQSHRLWANVLGFTDFHPGAWRFYLAVMEAGRLGFTRETYSKLVAAATGVNTVNVDSKVVSVIASTTATTRPMVITEHESILGSPDETATVVAGDLVAEGDFVFSGVNVWDCQNPPPAFISQLKIWPNYLSFEATGPVTVSASPAAPTFVTAGGKIRTRFPVTGEANDVAAFFAAQDAREDSSGISLLQAISKDLSPVPENVSSSRNWVEVLWEIWLRHGAVVTYISSDEPVLPEVDFRLQQIRRCVPPWITHLIQYIPSPNKTVC